MDITKSEGLETHKFAEFTLRNREKREYGIRKATVGLGVAYSLPMLHELASQHCSDQDLVQSSHAT